MNISNILDYYNSIAIERIILNALKNVIEYLYFGGFNPNLDIKSKTYLFKWVREKK